MGLYLNDNNIRDISPLDNIGSCDIGLESNPLGEFLLYTTSDFADTLANEDIVLNANKYVTITFKQGSTINTTENTEYDFSTSVVTDFASANVPETIKDSFIKKISYAYSGTLPATAEIQILVGTKYANTEVFYTLLNVDGTVNESEMQSAMVDEEGYITVTQEHCSDYVITSQKPSNPTNGTNQPSNDTNNAPSDSTDNTPSNDANNNVNDKNNTNTENTNTGNNSNTENQDSDTTDNKGVTSPKTGDIVLYIVWFVLLSSALLGMACLKRKQR